MRVTQQDIARYAQVSQATVSRVLSGDERVEPDIRDKVLAAIEAHNYRPDVRARSLRTRSAGLVGLAIQRPHGGLSGDPFYASLISELLDGLAESCSRLCLEAVPVGGSQWQVYDDMLRSRRVDGLILVESEAGDERLVRLHRDRFPFVLIGNPMGLSCLSVDNDNVYSGRLATQHLVESGYRRVGFLAGRKGVTVSDDRLEGYRQVVAEHNMAGLVWHADFGLRAAEAEAERALTGPDAPDAFVVLDDFMAMGVVLAARRLGLGIPDQLGLVGFNDSPVCNFLEDGLTSVSLDIPRLVRTALAFLKRAMQAKGEIGADREIVPCRLVVRGSSQRQRVAI